MYHALYATSGNKDKIKAELLGLYTDAELADAVLKHQKTKTLKKAEFYSVLATHHPRAVTGKAAKVIHSTNPRLQEKLSQAVS